MAQAPIPAHSPCGPWNPGIESSIPEELRALSTLLREENVSSGLAELRELRGFTGLDYAELTVFRPSRLALHELLIRVSANLSVPEGRRIEDLGVNFREMTRRLLGHLDPRMAEVDAACQSARGRLRTLVSGELESLTPENATLRAQDWTRRGQAAPATAESAACKALGRVVSAILVRHGRFWGPRDVIAAVATNMACNELGSEEVGRLIEPWVLAAAQREGYRRLPPQSRPMVLNTKGASASGKTTIRPLQRELAAKIGMDWGDFALVSPDIWRKQLLDYGSLGPHHKYAGPFTGEELRIVDQKLDQYMASKAERGEMPHLLIDRFRFDSFAPHSDEAGSNLLTRFGREVYLFFMVTAPASLVERAWNRGLEVGRYKAVDDTLAHAVEAYSGMPQLFFTWVQRGDKRVHFEFLDNEVPAGERPRTAAFGWNEVLNVLDVEVLLDIERFRHVNVQARSPEELFRDPARLAAAANAAFLRECVRRFPQVNFAERESGRVYLRVDRGAAQWADHPALYAALERSADLRAALAVAVPGATAAPPPGAPPLTLERAQTVGA